VLYQELCFGIAADPELLELAARAPVTQPAVNLLLAGAHYLLLKGARHPLREYYPALAAGECGRPEAAFPAFRSFCLEHRDELGSLIEKRLTQTNVIQRCTLLLPAFATVFERAGHRPLALIEIGPSAGLNMQWSRFRYAYRRPADPRVCAEWGDPEARVEVEAELRGEVPLPKLSPELRVAWRRGIDIHPVDPDDEDAVLWLRALVWPDHVGRQERLSRAIEVACCPSCSNRRRAMRRCACMERTRSISSPVKRGVVCFARCRRLRPSGRCGSSAANRPAIAAPSCG
jgi:hypothetical protein